MAQLTEISGEQKNGNYMENNRELYREQKN